MYKVNDELNYEDFLEKFYREFDLDVEFKENTSSTDYYRLTFTDRKIPHDIDMGMNFAPIPSCCGSMVFHACAYNYPTEDWDNNRIAKILANFFKVSALYMGEMDGRTQFLYFAADFQTVIITALRMAGFRRISTFNNPNSGNDVYTYELLVD